MDHGRFARSIRSFLKDTRSECIELMSPDVVVAMSRDSHRFSVHHGGRKTERMDGKDTQVHFVPQCQGEIRLYGSKARNIRWDSLTCAFLGWLLYFRNHRFAQTMKRYIPEKCIDVISNPKEGQVRAYRQPANHGLSLVCSIRVSKDLDDETCMDIHALADGWHPWTYRVTETLTQQCIVSSVEYGFELGTLIREIAKVSRCQVSVSVALGPVQIVVLDCERHGGVLLTGPGVQKVSLPPLGYILAACKATESLLHGFSWKSGFLVESTFEASLDAFQKRNTTEATEDALRAIAFCWELGIVRGLCSITETEACISELLEETTKTQSSMYIVASHYFMFDPCIADSVALSKKKFADKRNHDMAQHVLRLATQDLVPAIAKVGLPEDLRANLFSILRFWKCYQCLEI